VLNENLYMEEFAECILADLMQKLRNPKGLHLTWSDKIRQVAITEHKMAQFFWCSVLRYVMNDYGEGYEERASYLLPGQKAPDGLALVLEQNEIDGKRFLGASFGTVQKKKPVELDFPYIQ